jgi:hypothetical protein
MQGGGTLTLTQEGTRLRVRAQRPEDGLGLYKVWVSGQGGAQFLLGTMIPEGGVLQLKRTLSLSELERAGCWPVWQAQAPLVFPFSAFERWYHELHPEQFSADPVAKQQLKQPMLCSRGQEATRVAAPFRTDEPVALSALFCLAQVETLEGRPHLVWAFDRNGQPKFVHKGEKDGQNTSSTGNSPQ